MKNLEIGKIYYFEYDSEEHKPSKTPIKCKMSYNTISKLCEYLKNNSEKIVHQFEAFKISMKEYLELRKRYENFLSKKEKYSKKTQDEITLIQEIKTLKSMLFENIHSTPDIKKAQNVFIRSYSRDKIKNINEEESLDKEEICAVYAGQFITTTGKVRDKWYKINPTTVDKTKLNNNILKYVVMVDE